MASAVLATASLSLLAVAINGLAITHLSAEQQELLDEAHATFEGAWVATAANAGGFALYSSSVPTSLYATSWTIQLMRQADAIPDILEPGSVAELMNEAIAHPEEHGVPPLEAIWLALRTLDTLGIEMPAQTVALTLPYLTPSGLYSYEPAGEASWGATSIASRVLNLVGESAPPATVETVRNALAKSGLPTTIEELVNNHISIWEAADELLTDPERSAFQPKLDRIVAYFEHWVDSNPGYAGGPILGAAVSLDDIARRNSSSAPVVDRPALWSPLRTPNGGFAVGPGAPVPDPHTTYDALRLGAPMDPLGRDYFTARARSDGWPIDLTELDPCNTYMGAVVARAAGDRSHDDALSATAAQWLSDLNSQPEVSEPALCVLALAETISIEPPRALVDQMRTAASDWTSGTPAAPLSLRIRILLMVGSSGRPLAALASSNPEEQTQNMEAYEACLTYADLAGRRADCALPHELRMADGTYKQFPSAPVSDLEATVIALKSSGDTETRMAALSRFRANGHTWMVPVGATPNVNNLHSAFLGLVLAGVIPDPRFF